MTQLTLVSMMKIMTRPTLILMLKIMTCLILVLINDSPDTDTENDSLIIDTNYEDNDTSH